jgi:tRNA A-37 threonylcarbamoyl transferase component Bud32
MTKHDGSNERAQELFAQFLERREAEPGLEFQAWLAKLPADAPHVRLAAMHTKWNEGRALLGGGATSDSIEFGYELLDVIGSGGFGTVWRARNKALGRIDAIKVVRQQDVRADARRRFVEEAQRLASVDHPNVVKVYAIEEHDGGIRLVLEYVKGQTLEQFLTENGPFSPHEAARIGIDLCRALAALHAKDLVHLDVKTGNVMRGERGRIVLLDFGLARPRAKNASGAAEDTPLCGSPPYMAPEMFGGRGEVGPRADVYSLGVTLYRCATGRYPYRFERNEELVDAIIEGRRVPIAEVLPDVPAEFAALLERAMATDPTRRFESAGAFEAALRAFVGESAPVAQRSASKRRVWAFAGVGALAAAALFVALIPRPIDAEVTFFRHRGPGTRAEPLSGASKVNVGDKIFLTARASEPFYLYVFNQDLESRQFRLVPAGSELEFLPADTEVRRPADEKESWVVNTSGGTEYFFIVASPRELPQLGWLIKFIDEPGDVGELRAVLRGVGEIDDGGDPSVLMQGLDDPKVDLLVEFAYFEASLDPSQRVMFERLEMTND